MMSSSDRRDGATVATIDAVLMAKDNASLADSILSVDCEIETKDTAQSESASDHAVYSD